MKFWHTVNVVNLPDIYQNGIGNPYGEELTFDVDPEGVAENAMAEQEEGTVFLEIEIPDEDLEVYFAYCTGIHIDMASNEIVDIQSSIKDGRISDPDEVEAAYEQINRLENIESAADAIAMSGFVCLGTGEVIPPDLIKLLDPETMQEALWTADLGAVAAAVEGAEATPVTKLGASFWVWLMFLFQNIFAAGRGEIPTDPLWKTEAAAEKAEARKERRRKSARGRRKKKKKKRPKKRTEPVS